MSRTHILQQLQVQQRRFSPSDGPSNRSESLADLVDRLGTVEHAVFSAAHSPHTSSVSGSRSHLLPYAYPPLVPPHRQLANPSPLGLLGFAIVSTTTAAAKISSNPNAFGGGLVAAIAFFVGGVAQVLASLFQFLNNNTHSATTFGLFGLHWAGQSFVIAINAFTQIGFAAQTPPVVGAIYYALLTLSAIILWLPTFRMNNILCSTLFFVILAFLFDVPAEYNHRVPQIVSAVCGIIASMLALYMALLDLVNEAWKRPVLPLFPHKEHKHEYDSIDGIPYVPKRTYHKSAVSSVHL